MKKKKGILTSTLAVSSLVLVIKFFGMLKKSLIAAICGATIETDMLFLSTNLMYLIASMIFSALAVSLLTLNTRRIAAEGEASSNNLINAVLRVFMPAAALLTLVFFLFSRQIGHVLAPSYSGHHLDLLADYIKLLSVMFIFVGYFQLMNVVLESDKQFLPGKGYGLFQNVFVCIAVLVFYKKYGIISVVAASVLAGFAQCVQITWSARHKFHLLTKIRNENETIRTMVMLAMPLLLSNMVYEINDVVDRQIATGVGAGRVTVLSYGSSINEMITTLIISSVSTVLLAYFADWVSAGDIQRVKSGLLKAVEAMVVLLLPMMIMCFVCGDCIVDILYGYGKFGEEAARATTAVIYAYAAGFIFQAVRATLIRAFYAFQDMKTPMKNSVAAVITNIILSLLLSRRLDAAGIALATSISMLLVSAMLLPGLKKHIPELSIRPILPVCLKSTIAAVFVGIAAGYIRNVLSFGSLTEFVIIGIFVTGTYLALSYILGVKVILDLYKSVKSRLTGGAV